jgi:hypothetical protein
MRWLRADKGSFSTGSEAAGFFELTPLFEFTPLS